VKATIDPADLILTRCPIAGDGMDVAVDQAGGKRCAVGVDERRRAGDVDVFLFADGCDFAVDGDDRVGVQVAIDRRSATGRCFGLPILRGLRILSVPGAPFDSPCRLLCCSIPCLWPVSWCLCLYTNGRRTATNLYAEAEFGGERL
jgi:hypothetical protein